MMGLLRPPKGKHSESAQLRSSLGVLGALGLALFGIDRKITNVRADLEDLETRAQALSDRLYHAQMSVVGGEQYARELPVMEPLPVPDGPNDAQGETLPPPG